MEETGNDSDARKTEEKFMEELGVLDDEQAAMMTELRYGIQMKEGKEAADFMERMQVASGNNRILMTNTRRELES